MRATTRPTGRGRSKRTIQKLVLDPLARRVLEGEFGEGDTVTIDADGGALVFRKAAIAAPA